MIYARLLVQLGSSVAAKQQQFRKWHWFSGFGAEDWASSWGGSSSLKRKIELYDGVRLEARLRRFTRLRQADIAGQLQQTTGNSKAMFRRNQEEVVRAIVISYSPIVQIIGTGGSKRLSSMRLVFCSPDGVTVVITLPTALPTDLDAQYKKFCIASHVWLSHKNNQAAPVIFCRGALVVATNALGLGIDVPDRASGPGQDAEQVCRILDRVMGERTDRFECEAAEARCDRCQQRRWAEDVDEVLEQEIFGRGG
ncbi:hypothetical protein ColKHC_14312 [Colletotrichum higginsianum]|nr:hypothetical protein ColKHC_14312 [Colletotrichum higginsianum]